MKFKLKKNSGSCRNFFFELNLQMLIMVLDQELWPELHQLLLEFHPKVIP
jgi:hypothetical protein